jgi:hypothetical protein
MQGLGPYSNSIKKVEKEIKEMAKKVNDLCGMRPFLLFMKPSCEVIVLNF